MVAASELPINTGASAIEMAEAIMGAGVTVVNASYTGDNRSSGIYTNGDSVSPFATPGDTGVILSTGRARDFTNSRGDANHDPNTSTNTRGVNNNADFNAAPLAADVEAVLADDAAAVAADAAGAAALAVLLGVAVPHVLEAHGC